MNKLLATLLFAGICTAVDAQVAQSPFFFGAVPGAGMPHDVPNGKFYLHVPGLGRIQAEAAHTAFAVDDLARNDTFRIESLLEGLDDINRASVQNSLSLVEAGFKTGPLFWRLGLSQHAFFEFRYPRSLPELAWYGNGHPSQIGREIDLGGTALNGMAYLDLHAGLALELKDGAVRAGFNLHYLNGLGAVQTSQSDLTLRTDADTYALDASGAFTLRTAGFGDSLDTEELRFPAGNHGFALDAGAGITLDERLRLDAFVSDLGFIRWKENTRSYSANEAVSFTGVELNQLVGYEGQAEDFVDQFLDSLEDEFELVENEEAFTTLLNLRTGVRGELILAEKHAVGATLMYERFLGRGRFTPAVHFRTEPANWFGAFAQVSLFDTRFPLINGGLWLRGGPVFWHLAVFNIPAIPKIENARAAGFQTGFSLLFGRDKNAGRPMVGS